MTLVEDERTGLECHAYYNSGTYASPTWVEMKRAQDLSVSKGKGMADLKSRLSLFAFKRGTFKEVSLTFGYLYKAGTDAVRSALLASYMNNTSIEILILDDIVTESGAAGVRLYVEVSKFDDDQAMENGVAIAVEASPTMVYDGSGDLRRICGWCCDAQSFLDRQRIQFGVLRCSG